MGSHNVFNKELHPALETKPRVFISHRLADKPFAREIAAYFETIGLHYYFDEQDEVLARATSEGHSNDSAIVKAIDDGLRHSSHLLAVLSVRTMGSWWVPYEIGAARATERPVRHLVLRSVKPEMLPEYLRIYPQLWSAADLFGWASEFTPWRGHLVAEQCSEYLNDIFGELDPDEDTIEEWQRTAERINADWLARLERTFAKDVE